MGACGCLKSSKQRTLFLGTNLIDDRGITKAFLTNTRKIEVLAIGKNESIKLEIKLAHKEWKHLG